MFAGLLRILSSIADWIRLSSNVAFVVFQRAVRSQFLIFSFLLFSFKALYSGIVLSMDRILMSMDAIETSVLANGPSVASAGQVVISIFDKINYFFPLAELFGVMSALFVLWLASCSYRLVKSFIPTIA